MDHEQESENEGKGYFWTTMVAFALVMVIVLGFIVWAEHTSEQNPFPEHPEKRAARGSK